ncbi:ATPase domain-containing protein [Qipengyuania mesophila]|uniref:ATPase domain-containing protein n=1 Tax=Qipengyuania mesophila TaxID=2867246 RepID=UPI003519AE76
MGDVISTGITGLDTILNGGVPKSSITLLQGHAGSGKTTLGLQFLLEGAKKGERSLLISVAQTKTELEHIAASHGFDLGALDLEFVDIGHDGAPDQYAVNTQEEDLDDLLSQVHSIVERVKPERLVFDSLLEMRLLARSDYDHRRDVLALKRSLVKLGTTAIILDHVGEGLDRRIEGVAHGVIILDSYTPHIGTTYRRLMIRKFRGHRFIEGWHDFDIQPGGLDVFARLLPQRLPPQKVGKQLKTRVESLDVMLGGGLERATTTLIAGQSGTGKSTLATVFASAAAKQGMKAGLFLLEERPEVYRDRSEGVGIDVVEPEREGTLFLEHFDPSEVSVGHFSQTILNLVEEEDLDVVVIDSLSGFVSVLPERHNLIPQIQSLLQQLARQNLVVILTMSQHGLLGETPRTEVDVSFLADSIILLRHSPEGSEIRRTLAVVKKRHSDHDRRIKNFVIAPGKVDVEDIEEGTKRQIESQS